MRKSRTLQRFRDGEAVRVCALGHEIPAYVSLAARAGFDCIWFDLEHRAWEQGDVQAMLRLFHQFDIDCMLRPSTRERAKLYRYLEDGATGFMMPHVSTPELAKEIVAAVKFPPLGDRGLDGAGYDSDYYSHGIDEYVQHANRETFLVLQIETPQAVENVERIAEIPGVDALFVGPGDLGLRYRTEGCPDALEPAIERVAQAARDAGKAWGIPVGSREDLHHRRGQGAQLLPIGGEFMWLKQALERSVRLYEEETAIV
jgi:4-hydroxy-2-oxoheptanedioate aldolase